jgi:hypothetical protein
MEPMDEDGHDTGNTIEIPVWQSEETVAINLDEELPEDPEELCTLLENEHSEPKYWLAVGIAYARKNQVASAIEVLNKGLNGKYFSFISSQLLSHPFFERFWQFVEHGFNP